MKTITEKVKKPNIIFLNANCAIVWNNQWSRFKIHSLYC